MSQLFGDGNTTKGRVRGRSNKWIVFASLGVRGCPAVHRNDAKCVSLAEIQIPELSVADARRVLQHRLEHGLQIAREAADDLQHFGGGQLLLQTSARCSRASASSRLDALSFSSRSVLDA